MSSYYSESQQHKKPFKVLASAITLVAFFVNIFAYDIASAADSNQVSSNLVRIRDFCLPEYLGYVKDSWQPMGTFPKGTPFLVIHIQDAHCNYAAQNAIANIIDHLNNKYGIDTVNLEGGEDGYDLSPFEQINDNNLKYKAADYFLKEGEINAAEFYAINNPGKVKLWGVEDTSLYIKNLKVYRDSLKYKDEIAASLKSLNYLLSTLKVKLYSKDLLALDQKTADFNNKALDLKGYAAYLTQLAKNYNIDVKGLNNIAILNKTLAIEAGIDFKKSNLERDRLIDELNKSLSKIEIKELVEKAVEFKTGRISSVEFYTYLTGKAKELDVDLSGYPNLTLYIGYIGLYSTIHNEALFKEMDILEERIKDKLYRDDNERELTKLSKNFYLIRNLLNITLTQDDFKYYEEHKKDFEIDNFVRFIKAQEKIEKIGTVPAGDCPIFSGISKLDAHLKAMEQFYLLSYKRDEEFLKRLKGLSRNFGAVPNATVLITGGFHSENLAKLFKEHNISYVSIMPNFGLDEKESPYFRLLAGETSIFQNYIHPAISTLAHFAPFNEHASDVYGPEIDSARTICVADVAAGRIPTQVSGTPKPNIQPNAKVSQSDTSPERSSPERSSPERSEMKILNPPAGPRESASGIPDRRQTMIERMADENPLQFSKKSTTSYNFEDMAVVTDIHGHFDKTAELIGAYRYNWPKGRVVFLGDYLGLGREGLEGAAYLFKNRDDLAKEDVLLTAEGIFGTEALTGAIDVGLAEGVLGNHDIEFLSVMFAPHYNPAIFEQWLHGGAGIHILKSLNIWLKKYGEGKELWEKARSNERLKSLAENMRMKGRLYYVANDTLFTHCSAPYDSYGKPLVYRGLKGKAALDEIEKDIRKDGDGRFTGFETLLRSNGSSPFVGDPVLLTGKAGLLDSILAEFGASRLVKGHHKTGDVEVKADGKIISIDIGYAGPFKKGGLLIFDHKGIHFFRGDNLRKTTLVDRQRETEPISPRRSASGETIRTQEITRLPVSELLTRAIRGPPVKNIAFVTPEAVPISKTGGLGDVSGELPNMLAKLGYKVSIFTLLYKYERDAKTLIDYTKLKDLRGRPIKIKPVEIDSEPVTIELMIDARHLRANLLYADVDKVRYYFFELDIPEETGLTHHIYDWYTDETALNQAILLAMGSLEAIKKLAEKGLIETPQVINVADWQTGLLPAYLKTTYQNDPILKNIATVYTIHNLAYKGEFPANYFSYKGVDSYFARLGIDPSYKENLLDKDGRVNLMKTAIHYADILNTVSPTYAKEILTTSFGEGLDYILKLRENDLVGILNGIDYARWRMPVRTKAIAKKDLQNELGLKPDPDAPIISIISRLAGEQKGIDLILKRIRDILALNDSNVQFVLMGTGDPVLETEFMKLMDEFPGRVSINIIFDREINQKGLSYRSLAELIYAGSDMFLITSRFEPCGLTQMISMHYLTIPIARDTGGLRDTVQEFDPLLKTGNGFVFSNEYNSRTITKEAKYLLEKQGINPEDEDARLFFEAVKRAIDTYQNKAAWRRLQKNAMNSQNDWKVSAKSYAKLYKIAHQRRSASGATEDLVRLEKFILTAYPLVARFGPKALAEKMAPHFERYYRERADDKERVLLIPALTTLYGPEIVSRLERFIPWPGAVLFEGFSRSPFITERGLEEYVSKFEDIHSRFTQEESIDITDYLERFVRKAADFPIFVENPMFNTRQYMDNMLLVPDKTIAEILRANVGDIENRGRFIALLRHSDRSDDIDFLKEKVLSHEKLINANFGALELLSRKMDSNALRNIVGCVDIMVAEYVLLTKGLNPDKYEGGAVKTFWEEDLKPKLASYVASDEFRNLIYSLSYHDKLKNVKSLHELIVYLHAMSFLPLGEWAQKAGASHRLNICGKWLDIVDAGTVPAIHDNRINSYFLANILRAFDYDQEPLIGGKIVIADDVMTASLKLGVHIADLHAKFVPLDEGGVIRLRYQEAVLRGQNKARLQYLRKVLENMGFYVSVAGGNLDARFDKDHRRKKRGDIRVMLPNLLRTLYFCRCLDMDFDAIYKASKAKNPNITMDDIVDTAIDIFLTQNRILLQGVKSYEELIAIRDGFLNLWNQPEKRRALNDYLDAFGIPKISPHARLTQRSINTYVNRPIEERIDSGKLVWKDGHLILNIDHTLMKDLVEDISGSGAANLMETADIICVICSLINFRPIGTIGRLMAKVGTFKTSTGKQMVVTILTNPDTNSAIFARVFERDDPRNAYSADRVAKIVEGMGFDPLKIEHVSAKEIKRSRIMESFQRRWRSSKEGGLIYIRGTAGSSSSESFISGPITFNKDAPNPEAILVVQRISPEDVEMLTSFKGVITLEGARESHAFIILHDLGKHSVILQNGDIAGTPGHQNLSVTIYEPSPQDLFIEKGFIVSKRVMPVTHELKEGDVIHMSGSKGIMVVSETDRSGHVSQSMKDELSRIFMPVAVEQDRPQGISGVPTSHQIPQRERSDLVLDLRDVDRRDFSVAGPKGANLGELDKLNKRWHYNTAGGFVVTTNAILRYMYENRITGKIERIVSDASKTDKDKYEEIKNILKSKAGAGSAINNELRYLISEYIKKGKKWWAVRSSNISEDTESAAFAGMGQTCLYISREDVFDKVIENFASFATPKSLAYRRALGLPLDASIYSHAVIIQEMVNSDVAGVIFTKDSATRDENNIVITASYGLGEGVVSGIVAHPDRYTVAKKTLLELPLERIIGNKRQQVVQDPKGGTFVDSTPIARRGVRSLSHSWVKRLAKIALGIERYYGFPVDVEFAIEGNKLYILQVRPITKGVVSAEHMSDQQNFSGRRSSSGERSDIYNKVDMYYPKEILIDRPYGTLPVKVNITKVGEEELILAPDGVHEKFILNVGKLSLNGWQLLFARRTLTLPVEGKTPPSVIGLYLDDAERNKRYPLDISMLVPDQNKKIIALEDTRVLARDGKIFVYLTVVNEDGSYYAGIMTHDEKEFIRKMEPIIERIRVATAENPNTVINADWLEKEGIKIDWAWSEPKRAITDGPFKDCNIKNFVPIGDPFMRDGKEIYYASYRPDMASGVVDMNALPEELKSYTAGEIRALGISMMWLAGSENGLGGPWKHVGLSQTVNPEKARLGDSTYISGMPDHVPYHFVIQHISVEEGPFKHYDERMRVVDKKNISNFYLTPPFLEPPLPNSDKTVAGIKAWKPGAIYCCGVTVMGEPAFDNLGNGSFYFDSDYNVADTVSMRQSYFAEIETLQDEVSKDARGSASGKTDDIVTLAEEIYSNPIFNEEAVSLIRRFINTQGIKGLLHRINASAKAGNYRTVAGAIGELYHAGKFVEDGYDIVALGIGDAEMDTELDLIITKGDEFDFVEVKHDAAGAPIREGEKWFVVDLRREIKDKLRNFAKLLKLDKRKLIKAMQRQSIHDDDAEKIAEALLHPQYKPTLIISISYAAAKDMLAGRDKYSGIEGITAVEAAVRDYFRYESEQYQRDFIIEFKVIDTKPFFNQPPEGRFSASGKAELTEDEFRMAIEVAVYMNREAIKKDRKKDSEKVAGLCGLCREDVIRWINYLTDQKIQIIRHQAYNIFSGFKHAFLVVKSPVGKYYLIDTTFAQFFGPDAIRTQEGLSPEDNIDRENNPGWNMRRDALLKHGYIELDEAAADMYGCALRIVYPLDKHFTVNDFAQSSETPEQTAEVIGDFRPDELEEYMLPTGGTLQELYDMVRVARDSTTRMIDDKRVSPWGTSPIESPIDPIDEAREAMAGEAEVVELAEALKGTVRFANEPRIFFVPVTDPVTYDGGYQGVKHEIRHELDGFNIMTVFYDGTGKGLGDAYESVARKLKEPGALALAYIREGQYEIAEEIFGKNTNVKWIQEQIPEGSNIEVAKHIIVGLGILDYVRNGRPEKYDKTKLLNLLEKMAADQSCIESLRKDLDMLFSPKFVFLPKVRKIDINKIDEWKKNELEFARSA